MPFLFKKDDWGIWEGLTELCLRHIACDAQHTGHTHGGGDSESLGRCGCHGKCFMCKAEAPDEIKGFFELVKWKR